MCAKFYVKEEAIGGELRKAWEVARLFSDLGKADQESFWVLGMDRKNRQLLKECLAIGGIDACSVDLRILFKRLLIAGASSFIIVHNHPSGDTEPGEVDMQLTRRIDEAAKIIGLHLLDHLVIGDGFYSFCGNGFTFKSAD